MIKRLLPSCLWVSAVSCIGNKKYNFYSQYMILPIPKDTRVIISIYQNIFIYTFYNKLLFSYTQLSTIFYQNIFIYTFYNTLLFSYTQLFIKVKIEHFYLYI